MAEDNTPDVQTPLTGLEPGMDDSAVHPVMDDAAGGPTSDQVDDSLPDGETTSDPDAVEDAERDSGNSGNSGGN